MVSMLEFGLSNACFAAALAVIAWTFTQLSSNRHLAHLLWLLVLVKFVTPPLWTIHLPWAKPGSPISAAWADLSLSGQERVERLRGNPTETASELREAMVGETTSPHAPVASWTLPRRWGWSLGLVLAWAWSISSLICLGVVLLRVWRFQRVISARGTDSKELADRVAHFGRLVGLRRHVRVKVLEDDLPPMIWPLGRSPVMLLSRRLVDDLSDSQRDPIIVHELAHIRRCDDIVTLLEAGVTCLFWWNPVVWFARGQLRVAAEDCCDAIVVRILPRSRCRYGEALLRAAELSASKMSLPLLANTFGKQVSLKKRVEMILSHDYQGPPTAFGKMCFAVLAIFALPFAATAIAPMDDEPLMALVSDGTSERITGVPLDQAELSDVFQVASKNADQADGHFELWSMDRNGQHAQRLTHAPGYHIINSPEVSPDGRFVAVDGWKSNEVLTAARLLVIDLESGEVDDLGAGAMPNWAPDGNWIAYCKYSNEPGVFVRSLDGTTQRQIDPRGWGIQWSPDGWKVAYVRGSRFVVHDLVSTRAREIVPEDWNYTQIYWNPTWSPDSREICFKAKHRQGHTEFAIVNVASEVPTVRRRIRADGFLEDIAWHPDGARIVIPKAGAKGMHGQLYEFDPSTNDEPSRLAGQPIDRHNAGMCWSADGQSLFFISYN